MKVNTVIWQTIHVIWKKSQSECCVQMQGAVPPQVCLMPDSFFAVTFPLPSASPSLFLLKHPNLELLLVDALTQQSGRVTYSQEVSGSDFLPRIILLATMFLSIFAAHKDLVTKQFK